MIDKKEEKKTCDINGDINEIFGGICESNKKHFPSNGDFSKDLSKFYCNEVPEIFFRKETEENRGWRQFNWLRRKDNPSTEIFLNFDPLCNLHQLFGEEGNKAREVIIEAVRERFWEIFMSLLMPAAKIIWHSDLILLKHRLQIKLCVFPLEDYFFKYEGTFNNGEITIWLPNITLKKEFVFAFLGKLEESLQVKPIKVKIKNKEFEVLFNGFGYRYN